MTVLFLDVYFIFTRTERRGSIDQWRSTLPVISRPTWLPPHCSFCCSQRLTVKVLFWVHFSTFVIIAHRHLVVAVQRVEGKQKSAWDLFFGSIGTHLFVISRSLMPLLHIFFHQHNCIFYNVAPFITSLLFLVIWRMTSSQLLNLNYYLFTNRCKKIQVVCFIILMLLVLLILLLLLHLTSSTECFLVKQSNVSIYGLLITNYNVPRACWRLSAN